MSNPNSAIGVFDSGLGGLAVVREMEKYLPNENVIFVGDTARQPYGPRSQDEVRSYSEGITRFLISQGVKAVIIACNTASIAGQEAAQCVAGSVPVFGMIESGVSGAIAATENKNIGVWGTELTIASEAHLSQLLNSDPEIAAKGYAPSEMLRLAEKGKIQDTRHLEQLSSAAFSQVEAIDPDTLILGCTDFTCLLPIIRSTVPEHVKIIDPAEEVVKNVRAYLDENKLRATTNAGKVTFFVTGEDIQNFTDFTKVFLECDKPDVQPLSPAEVV